MERENRKTGINQVKREPHKTGLPLTLARGEPKKGGSNH